MQLLDTTPLRDQRTMVGVTTPEGAHKTAEDVEQAWVEWAEREGLPHRVRHGDRSTDLKRSRKRLVAFVSRGKWIADCPECSDGVAAWPFHERGCCLGCGTIYQLEYPTEKEILEAVELLQARPAEQRNWHIHQGEDVAFLARENDAYQFAAEPAGVVKVADLKNVLSKGAFAELKKSGLV